MSISKLAYCNLLMHYKAQLYPPLADALAVAKSIGYRIIVEDIDTGYCNFTERVISVPYWVFKMKDPNMCMWYLAHELAHQIAGFDADHDSNWRDIFNTICPKAYQHYEDMEVI